MHIWSLSLCLAFSYFSSVHSQECYSDLQCDVGEVCCANRCTSQTSCWRCDSDADCSYGEQCHSGTCIASTLPPFRTYPTFRPYTYPDFNIPTFHVPTYAPPDYNSCVWDSDCLGSSICNEDGQCVDEDRNEGAFSWSGSKVIGIVFFVAIATVISCLYHMCKRSRKPPELPRQIPPPTGVASEATTSTRVNEHELQQGNNGGFSGSTVIPVEEANGDSAPLPPGAPPPYSSLDFERQQRNGEPEQPPPSYDEAVRNSAMALV